MFSAFTPSNHFSLPSPSGLLNSPAVIPFECTDSRFDWPAHFSCKGGHQVYFLCPVVPLTVSQSGLESEGDINPR